MLEYSCFREDEKKKAQLANKTPNKEALRHLNKKIRLPLPNFTISIVLEIEGNALLGVYFTLDTLDSIALIVSSYNNFFYLSTLLSS